ncbi:Protein Mei2 [Trachipleistophora hominis]|uniref:Protein Mei2 n=1 Tax=Trachipleistophora hominis TaxID=72359 RepID=L7JWY3_TRAHO|nr:Protein Mei2 [Trachipleistophora hominis]
MYNSDNVERTGIQHGTCCAAAGSSLYSSHLVRLKTLPYFKPTPFTIIPSLIHQTTKLTVMLKNIPNKYTSSMLINLLNEDHYGSYDFVYLRMDFLNECNVGYAFINFVHANYLCSFYYKVHGRGWTKYSSNKIAEVTYASIQGIDALYRKFRNSPILHEQESFRPKMFYRDGPFRGIEKNVFEP